MSGDTLCPWRGTKYPPSGPTRPAGDQARRPEEFWARGHPATVAPTGLLAVIRPGRSAGKAGAACRKTADRCARPSVHNDPRSSAEPRAAAYFVKCPASAGGPSASRSLAPPAPGPRPPDRGARERRSSGPATKQRTSDEAADQQRESGPATKQRTSDEAADQQRESGPATRERTWEEKAGSRGGGGELGKHRLALAGEAAAGD